MQSHFRRLIVSTDKRLRKRASGADFGPQERWQHSGCAFEVTDKRGVVAARATEEHVLDVLSLKMLLSVLQVEAGLRFKSDYHKAAVAKRVTGSYSGAPSARDFFRAEHERSDAEEAAYKRWRAAVRELGMQYSEAVITTVCHDEPPAPRSLQALRVGLDKLAAWYGIKSDNGEMEARTR